MEIYTKEDLKVFGDKFDAVMNKVNILQSELFEPTKKESDSVIEILHKFISDKGRKIYGTYAMHFLLKNKNKNDAVYGEFDVPIIQVYSPTPLIDLKILCDDFYEKKFKYVLGKEAQTENVYVVIVNNQCYISLFYAPDNIYKGIPVIEIDKLNIVHPHYLLINYYSRLMQPLINYDNLKEIMKYEHKLQKYYPLRQDKIDYNIINKNTDISMLNGILSSIHTFLKSINTIVFIGLYAYSSVLQSCSIKNNQDYVPQNITHYEIISDNYKNDVNNLIELLKSKYSTNSSKFRIIEHYPFLDLYGHNTKIYYDDTLIFWGFDSDKKCIPYQNLNTITIDNNKINIDSEEVVKIGSFSLLIEMNLTMSMHYKLMKNKDMLNYHQKLTQSLFLLRTHYFKITNNTIMDKTPFQEITLQCIGTYTNPQIEYNKRVEKKKKEKSGAYVFKYEPSNVKVDVTSVKFSDSSSNPINNEDDLQLTK